MKGLMNVVFNTKKTSEFIKSAKDGFKALSVKQKVLFVASTLIPLGLCVWGFCLTDGTAWQHLFAAAFAVSSILSVKILAEKDYDTTLPVVKNALFSSAITFLASAIWLLTTNGVIKNGSAGALANFSMGYMLLVIVVVGFIGSKDSCSKNIFSKIVFWGAIISFSALGLGFLYEGLKEMFVMPSWLDSVCDVLGHVCIIILLLTLISTSVMIAKIDCNISGYKWCKRFGSLAFATVFIGAGSGYVFDLFNWSYNSQFGTTMGTVCLVAIALCSISGIIGCLQERRK
jgi:hypothetical protein